MSDTVHTLADLEDWREPGTSLAVLGHPIAHSLSPPMHNAALAEMAKLDPRFAQWHYYKFDVAPADLPKALMLLHQKGFQGVNLTIPHKVQALELIYKIDPAARRLGAVNTLQWQPEGYLGYNTDGFGLEKALAEELGVPLRNAVVILLGAGGAGRAAAVQCLESGCRELWIGNRSQERLQGLLAVARQIESASGRVRGFDLSNPPKALPRTGLLINATSVGLKNHDASPLALERFDKSLKVFDMIYRPAQTALLKEARQRGLACANGFAMLVWQGVRALEIWTGAPVPADSMRQAGRKELYGI